MKRIAFLTLLILALSFPARAQLPDSIPAADKVYGLSKFWQEVNYNFVYLDKIDRAAWDARYKELITIVQQTENDHAYYRELQKFCALLKDGHTYVLMPDYVDEHISVSHFGAYRLRLANIGGRVVLTRVNSSKQDELPIGTEIIAVNGVPTRAYMEQVVMPYLPSSTDHILEDWAARYLLECTWGTEFDLTLRRPDGKVVSLHLTSEESPEEELVPPQKEHGLLEFKWLEDGMAYVAINTFDDNRLKERLAETLPELQKAQRLIIDLRNNGGGSSRNALRVIDHLTNDSLITLSKWSTRQHLAAYKAWGEYVTAEDTLDDPWAAKSLLAAQDGLYEGDPVSTHRVDPDVPKVIVPTVVLIGHNTASAAEDFLIYTHGQKHMTRIGEPSFGSTGQPLTIDLPHGGIARICTKKDTYPDGTEFVGVGVQPDILVPRTLEDFLQDRDAALERAIEHLRAVKD